jgi:hypothetical protein
LGELGVVVGERVTPRREDAKKDGGRAGLCRAFAFEEGEGVFAEVVERGELLVGGAGDADTVLLANPALEILVDHYALEGQAAALELEAGDGYQAGFIAILDSEEIDRARAEIEVVVNLVLVVAVNGEDARARVVLGEAFLDELG